MYGGSGVSPTRSRASSARPSTRTIQPPLSESSGRTKNEPQPAVAVVVVEYRDRGPDLESTRLEQDDPVPGLVGVPEVEPRDLAAGVEPLALEACGHDARGVEDEQILGAEVHRQVADPRVLHQVRVGPAHDHEPRVVAGLGWSDRDAVGREVVVEFVGPHSEDSRQRGAVTPVNARCNPTPRGSVSIPCSLVVRVRTAILSV